MGLDIIYLSKVSKDLAEQLQKNEAIKRFISQTDALSLTQLMTLMREIELQKESERFLLASLHAPLLQDISRSLPQKQPKKTQETHKSASWSNKAKLLALALAGIAYFGCEGFDGVTALLGIFNLPSLAIFLVGLGFSLLSIVVFCAFDLVEISRNLGVEYRNSRKIIDIYLEEIEAIKAIRKQLRDNYSSLTSVAEIKEYLALLDSLQERHNGLNAERQQLMQALDRKGLKAAKIITSAVAGILFFSGGFFAGQTVALAVAGLFVAGTLAPTFWPILLVSVAVGLAAFAVYWFVERPGIENLIGRWFGLDKEKIDSFCSKEQVEKENQKLSVLKDNLQTYQDRLVEEQKLLKVTQRLQDDTQRLKKELQTATQQIKEAEKVSHKRWTTSRYPIFARDSEASKKDDFEVVVSKEDLVGKTQFSKSRSLNDITSLWRREDETTPSAYF